MKKLLIPILLLMIVVNVAAQTEYRRHEVALSYGIAPMTQGLDLFIFQEYVENKIGGVMGMDIKANNIESYGSYCLQYTYQPVRWFEYGVVSCLDRTTATVYQEVYTIDSTNYYRSEKDLIGVGALTFFTFMPVVKVNWFDIKFLGMYSKLALGFTHCLVKGNNLRNATTSYDVKSFEDIGYQISPICLQVGTPAFRTFIEAGFGYQGLINIGLKYKF